MTGIKKSAFWLSPLSVPTDVPTNVPIDFTPNSLKLLIVLSVPTGPTKIPLIGKRREIRKIQKLQQFHAKGRSVASHPEEPERGAFDINPLHHCTLHRQEMVAAGLTLLRGFIAVGKPRDKDAADWLASFEAWDDLIWQAVIWIGKQKIADVADPTACIRVAKEREPERVKLGTFLDVVSREFKETSWRTADLDERELPAS